MHTIWSNGDKNDDKKARRGGATQSSSRCWSWERERRPPSLVLSAGWVGSMETFGCLRPACDSICTIIVPEYMLDFASGRATDSLHGSYDRFALFTVERAYDHDPSHVHEVWPRPTSFKKTQKRRWFLPHGLIRDDQNICKTYVLIAIQISKNIIFFYHFNLASDHIARSWIKKKKKKKKKKNIFKVYI